jgi:putative NADH-flavin reductase
VTHSTPPNPRSRRRFLVFGGTGQTGQHFISIALAGGHQVRTLVRNPAKLRTTDPNLEVRPGSITDVLDLDDLVRDTDFVIAMLGDVALQRDQQITTPFVRKLIPAMRRHDVKRFLYQAGGLSAPPEERLSPTLWAIRKTLARGYNGQHEDNEAVMRYLAEEASDIEWIVHRAGIGSDNASKGVLRRSHTKFSVATFVDCAAYNYATLNDPAAIHTCDLSTYQA